MRKRISIASGLLAAFVAVPALAGNAQKNQETADAVVASLRGASELQGQRISVTVKDGVTTLSGRLSSQAGRHQAIDRARTTPGVVAVVDNLSVKPAEESVRPVQYQVAHGGLHGGGHGGAVIDGGAIGGLVGAPIVGDGMIIDDGNGNGPMPEGPAGFSGARQSSMPGYPNYAWPSYAPYPNFSAVGYPTAYPWQAWPNIGPFHPYPEVPLDWRAVTLRWDDGIWFLDFKKHYTRPFLTPYPFGIFSY